MVSTYVTGDFPLGRFEDNHISVSQSMWEL